MAPWILPALKAILPHVKTIYDTAAPVFTRKKAEAVPIIAALAVAFSLAALFISALIAALR